MQPILFSQPVFTPLSLYGTIFWGNAANTSLGTTTSWTDQSGNGNHATQGIVDAPVCTANQQNSKNTLIFNGNSTLVLPSALNAIPNNNHTIIAVAKQDVSALQRILTFAISGSARNLLEYIVTGGGRIQYYNNASFNAIATDINETNYNIIIGSKSGTTQSIAVNNAIAVTAGTAINVTGINQVVIGAVGNQDDRFLVGGIGELLIYNRILSAVEQTALINYLNSKWSVF